MLWRFQPQSEPFLYCFTSLHVYLYTFLGQGFFLSQPLCFGLLLHCTANYLHLHGWELWEKRSFAILDS